MTEVLKILRVFVDGDRSKDYGPVARSANSAVASVNMSYNVPIFYCDDITYLTKRSLHESEAT